MFILNIVHKKIRKSIELHFAKFKNITKKYHYRYSFINIVMKFKPLIS